MINKKIMIVVKIVVSIILISLIFTQVNLNEFIDLLKQIHILVFLAILLLYFLGQAINGIRWRLLINAPLRSLISIAFTSQFYAFFLPGQIAGEGAKAILASRIIKEKKKVFSSVIFDKYIGLIGVLCISFVSFFFTEYRYSLYIGILFFISLLIGVLFLILILVFNKKLLCNNIKNKFFKKIFLALSFWYHWIKDFNVFPKVFFLGILFQISAILIPYVISSSLGLNISFADWILIFGILTILVLFPISFLGIGVRDLTLVSILALYHINNEYGVLISMMILFLQFFGGVIGFIIDIYDKANQLKDDN